MNIFNNISHWYFSRRVLPYWCVLLIDCVIVFVGGLLGSYLTSDSGMDMALHFRPIVRGLFICVVPFIVTFRIFHTYAGVARYTSALELKHIIFATLSASLFLLAVSFIPGVSGSKIIMPTPICVGVIFVFSTFTMFMARLVMKFAYDSYRVSHSVKKVFVYGVKASGVALAKNMQNEMPQHYSVVGFVSPDGDLESKYLMGVQVRRVGPNLIKHMQDAGAQILLVSPMLIDAFRECQDLIDSLVANDIKIMIAPEIETWDGKTELSHEQLHEVEVEDLLPREKIQVDMAAIGELLTGKKILITGAAGSIGSEIVRQVAVYNPAELILIDQAETPMHDVRMMMSNNYGTIAAETIVASITDKAHMESIFKQHCPDYVFHAAAYKHVPMMEDNPAQAVRNNIYGTRVIADLAVKYGTRKFVMISTDKAVNPTNVMGCSKRICEIYCQSLNRAIERGEVQGHTQFVTTRFGNVLGSNGSVIPLFREQIKNGGPITVTHPDIIRFFMLIPEACKLVLEAGTMGRGGEIFVFDMGNPVRIADLAQRMIQLSGAKNIEIKYTGLRDGEKLYEEVLSEKENTKPTMHPKIMVATVREYDYKEACEGEELLMKASESFDDMAIVKIMKSIVPEYKSQSSKYTVLD